MKHSSLLLSLGTAALALLPLSVSAFSIDTYEAQTQVAHMYVTGALDQRMIDIASNLQTGEFNSIVAKIQKTAVARYCSFYFRFGADIGLVQPSSCDRTIVGTPEGADQSVAY